MQLPIKRTLDRLPGGMMIVPLFLGCTVASLFPRASSFFGSFTGSLLTGSSAIPIIAVVCVCIGASMSISATPYILKKGGALLATKICCGIVTGIILGRFLGEQPVRTGFF